MALELYKPDEATKSRGGIAILLAALLLYGVVSLYEWLGFGFWQEDLTRGLLGDEFPLSPRVVLAGALAVAVAVGIYILVNHVKVVEFLIATENEMQKVSWPARQEVVTSSIVVVLTVVILAIYLGAVDYGLVAFKEWPDWNLVWDRMFG